MLSAGGSLADWLPRQVGEALLTLAHGVGEPLFLVPVSDAAAGEMATTFAGLVYL